MACEISDVPIFSVHPVTLVCLLGIKPVTMKEIRLMGCSESTVILTEIFVSLLSDLYEGLSYRKLELEKNYLKKSKFQKWKNQEIRSSLPAFHILLFWRFILFHLFYFLHFMYASVHIFSPGLLFVMWKWWVRLKQRHMIWGIWRTVIVISLHFSLH